MRFVYNLQDATTSEDSDEPDTDSDESSGSRRAKHPSRRGRSGRQRMSIITNQLLNIPRLDENGDDSGCGSHTSEPQALPKSNPTRRMFFQSSARWDDHLRRVLVSYEGLAMPSVHVAEVRENGDHAGEPDASEGEDDMEVDEEEGES